MIAKWRMCAVVLLAGLTLGVVFADGWRAWPGIALITMLAGLLFERYDNNDILTAPALCVLALVGGAGLSLYKDLVWWQVVAIALANMIWFIASITVAMNAADEARRQKEMTSPHPF